MAPVFVDSLVGGDGEGSVPFGGIVIVGKDVPLDPGGTEVSVCTVVVGALVSVVATTAISKSTCCPTVAMVGKPGGVVTKLMYCPATLPDTVLALYVLMTGVKIVELDPNHVTAVMVTSFGSTPGSGSGSGIVVAAAVAVFLFSDIVVGVLID